MVISCNPGYLFYFQPFSSGLAPFKTPCIFLDPGFSPILQVGAKGSVEEAPTDLTCGAEVTWQERTPGRSSDSWHI